MSLMSARRLAGVSFWSAFSFAAQMLLFAVLTPVLLRTLGQELYGLWTLLTAIMGFAGIADLGIGSAVVRFVARYRATEEGRAQIMVPVAFGFAFLLCSSALAASALFLLRHRLAAWVTSTSAAHYGEMDRALAVVALTLVPMLLAQLPKGILVAFVRNHTAGAILLAQQATLLVGTLVLGLSRSGLVALAWWGLCTQTMAGTVLAVYAWAVLRKEIGVQWRPRWDTGYLREMLAYSSITWATNLGTALFGSADRIIVGSILGPAAAGVYAVLASAAAKLNSSLAPLTDLFMPVASSYQASGEKERLRVGLRFGSRLCATWVAALGSLLLLWGKPILSLWISPAFAALHHSSFSIMILAYALFSMNAVPYQIARGLGWLSFCSAVVLISGAMTLATIAVLGPKIGMIGAASANLVYCTTLLINFHIADRLEVGWLKGVLAPLGPPAVVLLAVAGLSGLAARSLSAAGCLTVLALGVLLWQQIAFDDTRRVLRAVFSKARPTEVA